MMSRAPARELREMLVGFAPEVVGFSVRNIDNVVAQRTSWHLDEVQEMIATTRANSRAVIGAGGPAVSILGTVALDRLGADFVIAGEGEESFPQLLSAIEAGTGYERVAGLCYRQGVELESNPSLRGERFGRSGMERWLDWGAYERAGGTWAIHTKRGCPMSCLYCNYPVMEGHRLRCRPAAEIVDEIESVKERVGPRTFEFTDSTFNLPEQHAAGICEEVIRRKLRVNLSAVGINPLGVSRELLKLMKQAGFCSLCYYSGLGQ